MAYRLVAFDMDGTLLKERTIFRLAEERGFVNKLRETIDGKKFGYEKTIEIAKFLRGMEVGKLLKIFRGIPLRENADEVVKELKKRDVITAIISNSYDLVVNDLKKRLGMDYAFANTLVVEDGFITGEVIPHNRNLEKKFPECRIHSICKRDVFLSLCRDMGIDARNAMAVGDGEVDICMLRAAGMGVAIGENERVKREADVVIENLMEILKYVDGSEEHGH